MSRYAIGVDLGTGSARPVLVDVADERRPATSVHPCGTRGVTDAMGTLRTLRGARHSGPIEVEASA